jgi:hypothetical protein
MKPKNNFETDLEANYTWSQTKTILGLYKLDEKEFNDWFVGQTAPVIEVNGKREIGIYGWDLHRYLEWKLNGTIPEFD